MAALTKAYEAYERPGLVVSYAMAAVKIFKGALVGVDGSGWARPMAPGTSNLKFVGVAAETVDNSGGSAGERSLNISKSGTFTFKAGAGFAPVQADLGKELNALTDWEVILAAPPAGTAYKVGTIVALERTSAGEAGVRVRIDRHVV